MTLPRRTKSNEQKNPKLRAAAFILLSLLLSGYVAQEPKVPEGPPPPELVGRWLEKNSDHKGDLVGYNLYVFSRKSEFFVGSLVQNEKTKRWVNPNKLYPKNRQSLLGYFEAAAPNSINFNVIVLGMAVLPFEMKYSVRDRTLTLSRNLFDPRGEKSVECERVGRLPNESKADFSDWEKRIANGLNGPDFPKMFEQAAHEMKDHPSDETMINNFDDHRENFEALRVMMQADKGLERVDPGFTQPEDPTAIGVTPERIEEYRSLSKKLGLERGVEAFGDGARRVGLLASCRGLSISGSSKTYVWLSTPPEPTDGRAVVEDLDAYVRERQKERAQYFKEHKRGMSGHVDAYRHIDGNWYLHYDD